MASNPWPVLVSCVILLPVVWAEYCYSYWHTDGYFHNTQPCAKYCCGTCYKRFCCSDKNYRLSHEKQEDCTGGPLHEKKVNIVLLVGSILGVVIPLFFCVCLVICCVAPCCLCYKKCRKGRNRGHRNVTTTTTVVSTPLQPLSPSGYQPSNPGYQPVPVHPGYGVPVHPGYGVPVHPGYGAPPNPSAPPPSYLEAATPTHSPSSLNPGQPMGFFPSQPTPHSDELSQPPYNPSYGLNRTA